MLTCLEDIDLLGVNNLISNSLVTNDCQSELYVSVMYLPSYLNRLSFASDITAVAPPKE